MKISELGARLNDIMERDGDIEVTCTGVLEHDGEPLDGKPFETTVETLTVSENVTIGKCVRLRL